MESKTASKKRKQSSVGPFHGTFTRSRSEIFLHRNRSGRARSDPNRTLKVQCSEALNDGPHSSVKDLRTRRVFSPASISDECYLEEKNYKIGAEPVDIKMELPEIRSNGEFDEKLRHGEQKHDRDGDILGEERLPTTSPDGDVFCKSAAEPDEGNTIGFDLQRTDPAVPPQPDGGNTVGFDLPSTDPAVENASSRSISRFDRTAMDPNNPSKNRLGLAPCSRSKLFPTPSSYSYRRLLPFIMDLANDNSITWKIHPCQKDEKIVVAGSLPLLSASPSRDSSICGANMNSLPVQHHSVALGLASPTVHPPSSSFAHSPNLDPSKQPITEIPSQNPPESLVLPTICNTLKSMPCSPYNECTSQNHQVTLDGIPIFPKVPIFSPSLSSSTCYPDIKGKIVEDMDDIKAELSETAKEGKFDPECCYIDWKIDGDIENLGGADCLSEEWFQTTPPDGDILSKSRVEEDRGNTVGFTLQGTDRAVEKPSCRNVSGSFRAEEPKNPSKNRVGLFPCSKIMKEKCLLPSPGSLSHEISTDRAEVESSSVGHNLGGWEGSSTSNSEDEAPTSRFSVVKCPNLDLFEQLTTESPIKSIIWAATYDTAATIPPNSYSERASQIHQVKSESSCKPDLSSEPVDSIHRTELPNKTSSFPPNSREPLSRENCSSNMHGTSHLSGKAEEDCTALTTLSTDVKPLEKLNLHRSASPQCPVLFERSSLAPTKGILKKHPQQCKGLCMCLDCVSFRLHAEKAYEFSRKQMQDAEGVVMGLMKELSCLRNLLEKSFAATVESAEDRVSIQLDKAKAACRRASREEELAKTCLRQMTCDLNFRCRITCLQRPRVRFANYVEKKLIPKCETEYIG